MIQILISASFFFLFFKNFVEIKVFFHSNIFTSKHTMNKDVNLVRMKGNRVSIPKQVRGYLGGSPEQLSLRKYNRNRGRRR